MILRAPAKLNLCLYVGPTRSDGLHELCSLFTPVGLADELTVMESGDGDLVEVSGLEEEGPDLTARALAALRDAGWERPWLRIGVDKRIPVAAGLGGGSADAAAVLRMAAEDLPGERIAAIARSLGADVTSQLDPRFCLVGGAGEELTELPAPAAFPVVLVPDPEGLPTPAVFEAADRLGLTRSGGDLRDLRGRLLEAASSGGHPLDYGDLLVNDLAAAAVSLRPSLAGTLRTIEEAGADLAIVTGSGPTAVGICRDRERAAGVSGELREAGFPVIAVDAGTY